MYEVILTDRALVELDQAHKWWSENRSPQQADRWYIGFVKKLLTLEYNPERYPLATENSFFPHEIRQFNYGLGVKLTHRALFTIRPDTVIVLRIRHLAQKPLAGDDG
jgi:plasmid stabilization system protein ParE